MTRVRLYPDVLKRLRKALRKRPYRKTTSFNRFVNLIIEMGLNGER